MNAAVLASALAPSHFHSQPLVDSSQHSVMGTPLTSSITKYGRPLSVAPPSNTFAMFGWSMIASAWRSTSPSDRSSWKISAARSKRVGPPLGAGSLGTGRILAPRGKPRSRGLPVAVGGHPGAPQDARDLVDAHAAEEAHLRDLGAARAECGEFGEQRVDAEDVEVLHLAPRGFDVADGDLGPFATPAALVGVSAAGVIDEDLAHGDGGDGHEVIPAAPACVTADQLEKGLVNEGGGLKGVGTPPGGLAG